MCSRFFQRFFLLASSIQQLFQKRINKMYCTRCGTYNSDESIACSNCSARLVKPAEIKQRANSSPGTEPYPNPLEQPTQTFQQNTGYSSVYAGQPAYQSYQNIQSPQI